MSADGKADSGKQRSTNWVIYPFQITQCFMYWIGVKSRCFVLWCQTDYLTFNDVSSFLLYCIYKSLLIKFLLNMMLWWRFHSIFYPIFVLWKAVLCQASCPRCTFSLRRTAATLRYRVSHRLLPSWTMALRWLARSVRFSLARRRYWLLTSSSWVNRSCTCLWKP